MLFMPNQYCACLIIHIHSPENAACRVIADFVQAMELSVIKCPNGSDCIITSSGNYSTYFVTIDAINANSLQYTASGNGASDNMAIYTPYHGSSAATNVTTILTAQNYDTAFDNVNIYAIQGFDNIIFNDETNGSFKYSTIYCNIYYTNECEIDFRDITYTGGKCTNTSQDNTCESVFGNQSAIYSTSWLSSSQYPNNGPKTTLSTIDTSTTETDTTDRDAGNRLWLTESFNIILVVKLLQIYL